MRGELGRLVFVGVLKTTKVKNQGLLLEKYSHNYLQRKTRGRERTEYDNKVPLFNVFLFELMLVQIVGETKFCT